MKKQPKTRFNRKCFQVWKYFILFRRTQYMFSCKPPFCIYDIDGLIYCLFVGKSYPLSRTADIYLPWGMTIYSPP